MIWSIPSSKDEILINTPIGAKSIRYLYFEQKQSGFFAYKTIPDSISISVDGKQICRNLVMLPFSTGTPNGIYRHKWQDVAIEVPLNINNSQVRISGVRNNDFNIIFVLSEDNVDESKGIEYYESFVLQYKSDNEADDALRAVMHTNTRNAESGQEYSLSLEYPPQGFFGYNITMGTNMIAAEFPRAISNLSYQPYYLLNISASDNEDISRNVHLALVSCTERIPHKKAYYELGENTHKNILVSIDTLDENGRNLANEVTILNMQTILFFKSKQVR